MFSNFLIPIFLIKNGLSLHRQYTWSGIPRTFILCRVQPALSGFPPSPELGVAVWSNVTLIPMALRILHSYHARAPVEWMVADGSPNDLTYGCLTASTTRPL